MTYVEHTWKVIPSNILSLPSNKTYFNLALSQLKWNVENKYIP